MSVIPRSVEHVTMSSKNRFGPVKMYSLLDQLTNSDHWQATGIVLSFPSAIRMHPSYHDQVLLVGVMYGLTS
jgi:hypothetical protein